MVMLNSPNAFFSQLPTLDEKLKKTFTQYILEQMTHIAENYPPQMRDLVVLGSTNRFIDGSVALMVMDILYENGTFRPLNEAEKITSNLIMFSDKLPQ